MHTIRSSVFISDEMCNVLIFTSVDGVHAERLIGPP